MVRFQCDENETNCPNTSEVPKKWWQLRPFTWWCSDHRRGWDGENGMRWGWDDHGEFIWDLFLMKNISPDLLYTGDFMVISMVICQIPKVWYGAMGSYLLTMRPPPPSALNVSMGILEAPGAGWNMLTTHMAWRPSLTKRDSHHHVAAWWFGTWLLWLSDFPYIGNSNPNWRTHIYQRGWNHQPGNFSCFFWVYLWMGDMNGYGFSSPVILWVILGHWMNRWRDWGTRFSDPDLPNANTFSDFTHHRAKECKRYIWFTGSVGSTCKKSQAKQCWELKNSHILDPLGWIFSPILLASETFQKIGSTSDSFGDPVDVLP